MRRPNELPPDPEVAGGLEAIESALAGRPVGPGHAEVAELAVVLAADRPQMDQGFAATLDERIATRRTARPATARRRRRWWVWSPSAALAVCLLVAVVIVTQQGGRTGASPPARQAIAVPSTAGGASAAAPVAPSAAPQAAGGSGQASPLVQPPANGRKITQSAQLSLSADPSRIDTVAQEVFDVIGQARGVVTNSTVTAGGPTGGYAQFQLSVPSASLPRTMAALSGLRYAHVSSRTDNSQDVADEYQRDVRRLADARALRTSLLRQLAHAGSQSEIDSLTARIHDAEASISSDQATLARLSHQINFSQIALTIDTGSTVGPAGSGSGFTLGKAAHTAGRVLTVAAGVILIAAAALVPLAGLAGLVWWTATLRRRRRREQALDLV